MFGHPSTVREAVPVWKAHLCQECEAEIVSEWKRKPITDTPNTHAVRPAPAGTHQHLVGPDFDLQK